MWLKHLLLAAMMLGPASAFAQAPATGGTPVPLPVVPNNSGSGADSSANAPTPLATLSTFTVTNPGAYRVQNQSAVTLQVQMCATGGTGCSIVLLAPGAGANAQGADTSPEIPWFTGVINVLGPTGSQFVARHN